MRIFDRKRINARTVIEQLEILFNMGRQLEDEVIKKQDELIAGENITIVDNVISANPGSSITAHTFATIGEAVTAVINNTNSFVKMNISGTIVTADYQFLVNGLLLTTPMIPINGQIDSARGTFVASSTQTTQEIEIFTLMFDSNGVRTVTSNYLISVNDIIVYY